MNRLHQLAINDEGFVFDPTTGESFTTNPTGLTILQGLRAQKSPSQIVEDLCADFEVQPEDAERDINDFIDVLRTHKLI
ncbi:MAG: PqqD family protein [Gemmatimonadetes bacterium]|nr:MAG: PqqD family protein [Gemmatimonadota bacterium]